jgi:hypothetical protein
MEIKNHDTNDCNHLFNCNDSWDCDCENEYGCEECNEEYESDDFVAAGLGMLIDDDGNWVPKD